MKTFLLAIAVCSLTAAAVYGQGRVKKADPVTVGYGDAHRYGSVSSIADLAKTVETGRDLFGAIEHWGEFVEGKEGVNSVAFFKMGAWPGTLWAKNPHDFKIGDWGCTVVQFKVIGKVSKTECLVEPMEQGSEVMLLRGLDMSKITDGVVFVLQHPVWIDSTYEYAAASGGQKTVLVLDHSGEKLKEAEAKTNAEAQTKQQAATEKAKVAEARKKAIEASKWRTWTDASGEHKMEAKYNGLISGSVLLIKRDGSKLKVPLEKLSDEDQAWIDNRSKSGQ